CSSHKPPSRIFSESPPASRRSPFRPASAKRAATVPPPAPEPTTMYSQSPCALVSELIFHLSQLESLQKLDQSVLVVIAKTGLVLVLHIAGAEIVAAID